MRSVVIKSTPFDEKVAKRNKQHDPPWVTEKEPAGAQKGRGGGGRGEETIIGQ